MPEHPLGDDVVAHEIADAGGVVACKRHDRVNVVAEVDEEPVWRGAVDELAHLGPWGFPRHELRHRVEGHAWDRRLVLCLELPNRRDGHREARHAVPELFYRAARHLTGGRRARKECCRERRRRTVATLTQRPRLRHRTFMQFDVYVRCGCRAPAGPLVGRQAGLSASMASCVLRGCSAAIRASSTRELMPSFSNACRRCMLTVCGERKRCAAAARLVIPLVIASTTATSLSVKAPQPRSGRSCLVT